MQRDIICLVLFDVLLNNCEGLGAAVADEFMVLGTGVFCMAVKNEDGFGDSNAGEVTLEEELQRRNGKVGTAQCRRCFEELREKF